MSNELTYHSAANSGNTLYAIVENATGQVWNGSAFEAPVSGNWTTYDIAMTEQATSTGIFRGNMPAAAAGMYRFTVRNQAGGSPAVSDSVLRSSELFGWDGSAVVSLAAIQAKTNRLGTGVVTVSSPVTDTLDIEIVEKDDYNNTEGRALEWSNEDGDWGADDITGATVDLVVTHKHTGEAMLTKEGSVVTATGTQLVRVELATGDTDNFTVGGDLYKYQLRLTLSGSSRIETIASGDVTVSKTLFSS